MKNLLLRSILLVSHREKKARKVKFHPDINIIKGENDTGKSCLIKSIYYGFGAEPHNMHHKWKDADVAVLVNFTVNQDDYSIYRHRNSYSLFNKNDELIGTYRRVTTELAPVLSKIFDFNLRLPDRNGKSMIAPPAYLFLPFYIDQDKGWVTTWNSFKQLNQFNNYKKLVSSYHFGLKPDKWYTLDANKKEKIKHLEEPERQLNSLKQLLKRTKKKLSRIDFEIDVNLFKKEIEELLEKCNKLKIDEEKYRNTITNLNTEKIRLDAQIEIVIKTHDELSSDYKYAVENLGEHVDCPTCGAQYNNSFSERFSIAQDTETCSDLLFELKNNLNKVEIKLDRTKKTLLSTYKMQDEINNILSKKQGQVKLADIIKIEGKKELVKNLIDDINKYENELNIINKSISEIDNKMSKYENKERIKKIKEEYADNIRKHTMELSVSSLNDSVYKNIDCNIEETGSDYPRAILAYNFATLKAIENNHNSTFCPIIIDAPNQQEQDKSNLEKILNFISKHKHENRQLIVGLVDDCDIDFGGKTIELIDKLSVLQESEYSNLAKEIKYFENKNLDI